jgi:ADP-ribosyl-[dinitrogen reductase] hydrolase
MQSERIAEQNALLSHFAFERINRTPALAARFRAVKEVSGYGELLKYCNDPSARIRREAAKRLSVFISEPVVLAVLRDMVKDQDAQVRWFAALALGKAEPAECREQIISAIRSRNVEQWLLASLLQRQAVLPETRPLLLAGEEAADPIRNIALYLLGRSGDLTYVFRHVADRSAALRDTVLTFANQEGEREIVSLLAEDADIDIASRARRLLGQEQTRFLNCGIPLDRLSAVLLAEAIGDALGAPVEFSTLAQIEQLKTIDDYLQDPVRPLAPGDYTDDTQMALMVARSLIRTGTIDPADVAEVFAAFCLSLDLGEIRNVGYSPTTLSSFRQLYAGQNWRFSGQKSNGCGPSTAVVPLGLVVEDLEALKQAVAKVTLITKTGAESLAGALAISYLVHQGVRDHLPDSPTAIIDETADFVRSASSIMANEIDRLKSLLSLSTRAGLNLIPSQADGKKVLVGMRALGVVSSAIYAAVKNLDNFEQTVKATLATEGDTDSIACLAAVINAARLGLTSIPAHWLAGLIEQQSIGEIAQKLKFLPEFNDKHTG